jgi:hypothetical protein
MILKPYKQHAQGTPSLDGGNDQNDKLHCHKYTDVQADNTEKMRNKSSTKKDQMVGKGINSTKFN